MRKAFVDNENWKMLHLKSSSMMENAGKQNLGWLHKKDNEENKTFMRRRLGICLTRSDFWTFAFPWCIKFRVRGIKIAFVLTLNLLVLQFLSFCSSLQLLKGFQCAFLLIRDSRP